MLQHRGYLRKVRTRGGVRASAARRLRPGGGVALSRICAGITRSGSRCTTVVRPPQKHCYQHDPLRREERRANAAKAGRSRPNRELQAVKDQLRALTAKVLAGEVERADAIAAGQLLGVWLRASELQRRVAETQELIGRLEDLEGKVGARWTG